jgi:hypothetical protein
VRPSAGGFTFIRMPGTCSTTRTAISEWEWQTTR